MRKLLFIIVFFSGAATAQFRQMSSVSCTSYLDQSPLARASGYGEENVVNTNY